MASETDSKKLCDLRVIDLRAELEKRGLDKTGNKANLIERLQKALISEGENPDEYNFDLSNKKIEKRTLSTNDNAEIAPAEMANETSETQLENTETTETQLNENDEDTKLIDSVGAESPLNLSIGEEEENLLLTSGEDIEHTDAPGETESDGKPGPGSGQDTRSEKPKEAVSSDNETIQKRKEESTEQDEKSNNKDSSPRGEVNTKEKPADNAPDSSPKDTATSDKHSKVDKNKMTKSNTGRSLWVTNLLPSTRAQELKHLLSRYGKVIGAKVVQSSRYPRTRCYGYVTLETRSDADLCIKKLNNTELKGQIIRVTKVRPEHNLPLKTEINTPKKIETSEEKLKSCTPQKEDKSDADGERRKSEGSVEKKKDEKAEKNDSKKLKSDEKSDSSSRKEKSLSPGKRVSGSSRDRRPDILTFDKIREERERQRRRERERAMREEEKRRRDILRAREIEKRHREEAVRLERECEKLRMERDRLDRQRIEIIRMERERQKMEREKLEREKQELRREQLRMEEARRPVKRPSSTSGYRHEGSTYTDDRKRLATERHFEGTPPPPRFEVSSRDPVPEKKEIPKDYKTRMTYPKREEFSKRPEFKSDFRPSERHSGGHPGHMVHSVNNGAPSSKYETPPYVAREREREREIPRESNRREPIIPTVSPPRISKDSRYGDRDRSPAAYRPIRDDRDRRPIPDHQHKTELRTQRDHRYVDSPSLKDNSRYRESGNSWHSSNSSVAKPFGNNIVGTSTSVRESWSKSDSWRPIDTSSSDRLLLTHPLLKRLSNSHLMSCAMPLTKSMDWKRGNL